LFGSAILSIETRKRVDDKKAAHPGKDGPPVIRARQESLAANPEHAHDPPARRAVAMMHMKMKPRDHEHGQETSAHA
jgi:hypothetical protein